MKKIKSIQMLIVLWVAICLLVAIGLLTGYSAVVTRNNTMQAAKDALKAEAQSRANFIDAEMEIPLDAGRTLAQALSSKVNSGNSLSRDEVTAMLKEVLVQNPAFFGVSTEWEPNAFDGMDSKFANTENTDETGHFSPYWYRDGNAIALTYLPKLAEDDPAYIYYTIPKQTLQETVTDPYIYPINGKDVLMTSFMTPIVIDGKFYGVAGIDMTLDFLQSYTNQVVEYNAAAELSVFSHSGIIGGATSRAELVGKEISEMHADYEEDLQTIQSGQAIQEEDEGNILSSAPMYFGKSPKPWAVQMSLPIRVITSQASASMWQMIGIGFGVFIITLLVLFFVAGSIAKPIKTVTQSALLLARGDASSSGVIQTEMQAINTRADELGNIGRAFSNLTAYFNEMASHAAEIAQGNLAVNIKPASDQDLLGNAFLKMVANLREQISQLARSAENLNLASSELANASNQAGQATSQ
ncbi:MAG: hypothetical protein CVU39_27485, partial [Chloroflexi bacterium HGW-Chloroflexi-10]